MSTATSTETREIAATIRSQIGPSVLMSLGAHDLGCGTIAHQKGQRGLPTMAFKARILPFTKTGKRGATPRNMHVVISLDSNDTYVVTVAYQNRGERVDHFHTADVYAEDLPRLLLALDYDGDTVLNPRLA